MYFKVVLHFLAKYAIHKNERYIIIIKQQFKLEYQFFSKVLSLAGKHFICGIGFS